MTTACRILASAITVQQIVVAAARVAGQRLAALARDELTRHARDGDARLGFAGEAAVGITVREGGVRAVAVKATAGVGGGAATEKSANHDLSWR